ncbi:MAG: hypothetical protein ACREND_14620 [Gemmatimonadaceae bacterium]
MHNASRTSCLLAALSFVAVLPLVSCMNGEATGGAAWTGPPFSAEIVDPANPTKPASRIYLGDGKVRLESEDTSSIGAIVVDPAHGTTLIVNDQAKSYIDAGMFTSLVTIGFAPLMRVLRPAGAGDPCSQWNSAINPFGAFAKKDNGAPPPQYTCRSLGAESVNGRAAQKWAVTSNDPNDGPMTIWVDDRLHIMSRSQDKDGAMEMRNIREGALPDSLFSPPGSYRKLSIAGMLGGMLNGSNGNGQSAASTEFLKKLQGSGSH